MRSLFSCGLFLLVAGFGHADEPVIEFRGVMAGDGPTKLSLVDKSNAITRWVEVGQTFADFKVKGYDTAKETATLTKDGREYQIRLNTSKIIEIESGPSGGAAASAPIVPIMKYPNETSPANETALAIFKHLQQIAAAADQYYLKYGKNTVTLDELVGPTKYIRQFKPEAGEDYSVLKLSSGSSPLSVTTASGEKVTYDAVGNASSFHFVQGGDTLALIAAKAGVPVSQLVELNQINDPAKAKIGGYLRTK